jgi:hypothetical protein
MTLTAQRILVAVAAVLAIVWLAAAYDDANTVRDAQIVAADPKSSITAVEGVLRDLRGTFPLDPSRGTERLSYQASLDIRLRRFPEALRTLQEVVKREPDTPEAWFLIAQLSQQSDPALSARARAQVRRLDPRQARGQR